MARVIIPYELEKEIYKRFKGESVKIFELMFSLKEFPKKGKFVGKIGKIAIKELRYKSFRFYFLVDAFKVKFLKLDDLENLLIKFIRMSDKKNQQKVIDEIKDFLRKIRS